MKHFLLEAAYAVTVVLTQSPASHRPVPKGLTSPSEMNKNFGREKTFQLAENPRQCVRPWKEAKPRPEGMKKALFFLEDFHLCEDLSSSVLVRHEIRWELPDGGKSAK